MARVSLEALVSAERRAPTMFIIANKMGMDEGSLTLGKSGRQRNPFTTPSAL